MAIDTQQKRMSTIAISHYAMGPSLIGDGSWSQADRQVVGYNYSGNLVEAPGAVTDVFFENRHAIQLGIKANTAAQMGGVLIVDL